MHDCSPHVQLNGVQLAQAPRELIFDTASEARPQEEAAISQCGTTVSPAQVHSTKENPAVSQQFFINGQFCTPAKENLAKEQSTSVEASQLVSKRSNVTPPEKETRKIAKKDPIDDTQKDDASSLQQLQHEPDIAGAQRNTHVEAHLEYTDRSPARTQNNFKDEIGKLKSSNEKHEAQATHTIQEMHTVSNDNSHRQVMGTHKKETVAVCTRKKLGPGRNSTTCNTNTASYGESASESTTSERLTEPVSGVKAQSQRQDSTSSSSTSSSSRRSTCTRTCNDTAEDDTSSSPAYAGPVDRSNKRTRQQSRCQGVPSDSKRPRRLASRQATSSSSGSRSSSTSIRKTRRYRSASSRQRQNSGFSRNRSGRKACPEIRRRRRSTSGSRVARMRRISPAPAVNSKKVLLKPSDKFNKMWK